ncbi:MAG: hypothetical protein ACHQD8_02645 [Chitinophagales bacterium]
MKRALRNFYFFLPVQLLLLHFRKYQLLQFFWLILLLTLTGNFASHFGASSLFLAPEYLGRISFASMFLLGCALCVFIMTWHITTFIIHSKRMPFMGATRHAFVVYCINNSIIPVAFLVFYSVVTIHFQWYDEHAPLSNIIWLQFGFYFGLSTIVLASFAYFFRVSRDYFKALLSKITNPGRIRDIVPYDSLDYEIDIIPTHSYISGKLTIEKSEDLEPYHPRVMNTILRRHHRNVIFATLVTYILLLIMGIFMDRPLLRVPAGASFLLLFSIIMGVVGAFKYFLKSWETLGWVIFLLLLATMVKYKLFDLRSVAYGLKYTLPAKQQPVYDYEHLRAIFTPQRFADNKKIEEARLQLWKSKNTPDSTNPPLVVITVSGGGSRSAYWTFRTLQYADSVTKGRLFRNTVLLTGASGGMIGATYWRNIHDAYQQGLLKDPYARRYQENIGKDLLNSIIFSLASVDLVSPFNKINIAGYSYTRDRGYAVEQEMISNTEGLLDKNIGYFKKREATGQIPLLIINGTIVNDGRKLMISNQPVGYLTQPEYSLNEPNPPIDAVDFASFFTGADPYNLRITSALRMNATFPFILPVVKLPSLPVMNIMDAGLRDNFGGEVASRYLYVMRDWLLNNTREIIFLDIRDTRENDVGTNADQSSSLGKMLVDPLFVIQNKWEVFQSYSFGFLKDYTPSTLNGKLRFVTLQYVPRESKKVAALNFHLTQKEKEDLYQSIDNPENQAAIDTLLQLLR